MPIMNWIKTNKSECNPDRIEMLQVRYRADQGIAIWMVLDRAEEARSPVGFQSLVWIPRFLLSPGNKCTSCTHFPGTYDTYLSYI